MKKILLILILLFFSNCTSKKTALDKLDSILSIEIVYDHLVTDIKYEINLSVDNNDLILFELKSSVKRQLSSIKNEHSYFKMLTDITKDWEKYEPKSQNIITQSTVILKFRNETKYIKIHPIGETGFPNKYDKFIKIITELSKSLNFPI